MQSVMQVVVAKQVMEVLKVVVATILVFVKSLSLHLLLTLLIDSIR